MPQQQPRHLPPITSLPEVFNPNVWSSCHT